MEYRTTFVPFAFVGCADLCLDSCGGWDGCFSWLGLGCFAVLGGLGPVTVVEMELHTM